METELSFDVLPLRLQESLMGRLEMVICNYQHELRAEEKKNNAGTAGGSRESLCFSAVVQGELVG